ncbi:MAG: hypothetical protein KDK45_02295 [Leptospiraceae bacterium]|nr:hypothetical protein [Leptospiraceae bacterium]
MSKPKEIYLEYAPGFLEETLELCKLSLVNSLREHRFSPEILLDGNRIRIKNLHYYSYVEFLLKANFLADVRLLLYRFPNHPSILDKKFGNYEYEYILNNHSCIHLHTRIASFSHINMLELKSLFLRALGDKLKIREEEGGIPIYLEADKKYISAYLSLAGQKLYKRQYRITLSKSAPIREDIAILSMQRMKTFLDKNGLKFLPERVFIPFCGSMTFGIEFLNFINSVSNLQFTREFSLVSLTFFQKEHYEFLKNHLLLSRINYLPKQIIGLDIHSEALQVAESNIQKFLSLFSKTGTSERNLFSLYKADFFSEGNFEAELVGELFVPLNPPYGKRMLSAGRISENYSRIAKKLVSIQNKRKDLLYGFIFCPDEDSYKAFDSHLPETCIREAAYFSQGGLPIKVCLFLFSS